MTTKTVLLQTIRKHCLECCGGSFKDVDNCAAAPNASHYSSCALWIYRNGKDPDEPSEAMQEKGRKMVAKREIERKHSIKMKPSNQREKLNVVE